MTVTQSNINIELAKAINTISMIDPATITEDDLITILTSFIQCDREIKRFRTETIKLFKAHAALHTLDYYSDNETFYIGPKAYNTRLKNTASQTGWVLNYVNQRTDLALIKKAVDEMNTYGHRPKPRKENK